MISGKLSAKGISIAVTLVRWKMMRVTTFSVNKEIAGKTMMLSFASSMRGSAKCITTTSDACLND